MDSKVFSQRIRTTKLLSKDYINVELDTYFKYDISSQAVSEGGSRYFFRQWLKHFVILLYEKHT